MITTTPRAAKQFHRQSDRHFLTSAHSRHYNRWQRKSTTASYVHRNTATFQQLCTHNDRELSLTTSSQSAI